MNQHIVLECNFKLCSSTCCLTLSQIHFLILRNWQLALQLKLPVLVPLKALASRCRASLNQQVSFMQNHAHIETLHTRTRNAKVWRLIMITACVLFVHTWVVYKNNWFVWKIIPTTTHYIILWHVSLIWKLNEPATHFMSSTTGLIKLILSDYLHKQ